MLYDKDGRAYTIENRWCQGWDPNNAHIVMCQGRNRHSKLLCRPLPQSALSFPPVCTEGNSYDDGMTFCEKQQYFPDALPSSSTRRDERSSRGGKVLESWASLCCIYDTNRHVARAVPLTQCDWLPRLYNKLRAPALSRDPHIPQANTSPGNLSEDDEWLWGDEDLKRPKINITPKAWSATNTDVDEMDDTRGVASAGTSNTSRGPSSSRWLARLLRVTSPSVPQVAPPVQTQPLKDTRSSSRASAGDNSSIINGLAIWVDAGSSTQFPPLEQPQPEWDVSGPSPILFSRSSRPGFRTYAGEKWAHPIAATRPSRDSREKRSSAAANSGALRRPGASAQTMPIPPISDGTRKNVKMAPVKMY
ncbi:hypothetical protein BC827DRAFT_1384853 [Russula dissimulans]|nr:hypothetical protein BC827DRAFT_1384853 [Russula dissimulans]